MARRVKPRTPARTSTAPVPGQLGMFGSPDPWQPSRGCECRPPAPRGCHHCKHCDTCQDCGRCAGSGCDCDCEETSR